MAQYTIQFDKKNELARKTFEYISSLGVFEIIESQKKTDKPQKDSKENFEKEFRQAVREANHITKSKKEGKTFEALLDEL